MGLTPRDALAAVLAISYVTAGASALFGCGSAGPRDTADGRDGVAGGEPDGQGAAAATQGPPAVQPWSSACETPLTALRQVPEASDFVALLGPTLMEQTLEEMQGGTLFVPTNDAMRAFDASLRDDPGALRNWVAGHFTIGTMSAAALLEAGSVELLDQQRTTVTVALDRGATQVGPAYLVRPDLACPGVTVHLVSALLPVGAFDASRSPNPFQVNLWRMPAE